MENEKISVKTCGKLYIAGEYSVLKCGNSAIIKNVDIFMKARINFSKTPEYRIFSDMFDYSVTLEYDKDYLLIQSTIKNVNDFLILNGIDPEAIDLEITGKMEKNGKKYGIGSSGSVVVLVIKAMFELYCKKSDKKFFSKETIFKLAAYTLLKLGDNGSMGDLACISYESMVFYTSFDRKKIKKFVDKKDLKKVLKIDWGYKIEKIKCGIKCEFLVGWTKKPSISSEMIKIVKSSIDEKFLNEVQNIVNNLKVAIVNGEKENMKKLITENGNILKNLNKNIYSPELIKLVKASEGLDVCAKSSGSGGGDCGIAFSFDENDSRELTKRWEKLGIETIFLEKL